ncbi:MAG TPA: hypothetical protein PKK74_09485 [Candidatus Methanoculleus thermohydrogenotrophicum]|jgi:hypothetical protein|nr:hypothetical protein [Candidatus Methanoculleus thermohydrogenotrophicum]NLM82295.1 hypothetical protein [Candidatus Methanoculleus thermohydrogenotrophicum]HOB18905.1 hypothetical protein [Candidatus Methanoculleus thermohydrogenotrophicum]HPZ38784.1 hypothetical protein [Candidatus Methanoculleus thermohydrogenotrophicum]HQC92054.1 hypothetical protein [Candidatus Methanoculleus thermohydrogenotrophicum]
MESPTSTPEGTAFPPDLERLGIVPGAKIDIRDLDRMGRRHNFQIFLYFEEDLVRSSTLQEDLREFGDVPDLERPFIRLDAFLKFATESDPLFARRLEELPLVIEVVAYGEMKIGERGLVAYIKGLMPFLDELAVEDITP